MNRRSTAFVVAVLMSAFMLTWVAMPVIQAAVPAWIVVDGLIGQIIILTALSGVK